MVVNTCSLIEALVTSCHGSPPLRVLAHSNARALLIDPIELPNHGVVACGLGLKNTRTQSRL